MGLNSKAVEARERKADQKKTATEKAVKAAEDAQWADDDKNLAKKKSKKEEEERKRAELLRKKAENKALLEQEMNSIKVTAKQSIQKVTQSQIRTETEKRNKVIENLNKPAEEPVQKISREINEYFLNSQKLHLNQQVKTQLVNEEPIVENLNRLEPETIVASGIDEAIAALRFVIFIRAADCTHSDSTMSIHIFPFSLQCGISWYGQAPREAYEGRFQSI